MPAKALGPLMAALPQAPTDLRLNQRLAALHTRAARFAEAGVCCRTLQNIYSEAGYPEEATRYGELGDRYEDRSASASAVEHAVSPAQSTAATPSAEAPSSAPWPATPPHPREESEFAVVADQPEHQSHEQSPVAPEAASGPAEIDLSEWDDSITIETDMPPVSAEIEVTDAAVDQDVPVAIHDAQKTAEAIEEFRFYLDHGMPEQASAAFEKIQSLTSDEATLNALRAEIETASQDPSADEEVPTVEAASEFTIDEPVAEFTVDEVPAAAHEAPAIVEPPVPVTQSHVPAAQHAAPIAPELPVEEAAAAPAPGVLQEFVSDLESSLGETFLPGAVPHQAPAE